jgi:excisionase family DNA binding protein
MVRREEQPAEGFNLLTPGEAAAELRTSEKTVIRLIRAGKLAAHNVGFGTVRPRYRIPRSAITRFLSESTVVASSVDVGHRPRSRRSITPVDYFN